MSDSQPMITRVTLTFEWSDGSVETADFKDPKKALFNQEMPLTELHVEPARTITRPETPTVNVEIKPGRNGWTLYAPPTSGTSRCRCGVKLVATGATWEHVTKMGETPCNVPQPVGPEIS